MWGKNPCERATSGLEMRQKNVLVEGKPKVTSRENGREVMPPTTMEGVGRQRGCCSKE